MSKGYTATYMRKIVRERIKPLNKRIQELEAALERVRALPDKWRNRAILQRNSATTSSAADQFDKGESKGTSDCADELEAAIKGEGDESVAGV